MLEQEALVIRSCVCTGLTELRNANLNEKGRFYAGFFQLAIGIERLAKLALILDHMAQNNLRPPGQQTVRAYGHDLETLVATVDRAASARSYQVNGSFSRSTLCSSILAFLSQFATGMRYANLGWSCFRSPPARPINRVEHYPPVRRSKCPSVHVRSNSRKVSGYRTRHCWLHNGHCARSWR
jgi:hypothetical protein